jgi:hypothetical protein
MGLEAKILTMASFKTGMGCELRRTRPLRRGVLHSLIEPIDVLIQLLIQRLELIATMRGVRGQRQRRQHRLAVSIPQRMSALHAIPQSDRVQRVLHARPQAHPLVPVQQ